MRKLWERGVKMGYRSNGKNLTLSESLLEKGYTHKKSETIDGKQDIFKDGKLIGVYSASQAWEMLKSEQIIETCLK